MESIGDLLAKALSASIPFADKATRQNEYAQPGDYLGDDGLLVCGKCHTRKQCRIETVFDVPVTIEPFCMCKCAREEFEREEARRKREEDMRRVDELRKASLMTGRMKDYTFDKFDERPENKRLKAILTRYVDNFPEMLLRNQGIVFWGSVASGKTFGAACVANALLAKGIPVLATSMVKIMQSDRFGDGDDELMRKANSAKLMVLDDLGAERSTDFALERVYGVIDSRSRAGLPMIITTNLSLSQLRGADDIRYQRIYSRILETCYPIEVNGISWRNESAADRYDEMRDILEGGL